VASSGDDGSGYLAVPEDGEVQGPGRSPREVVLAHVAAFNARDVQALRAGSHEHVEFRTGRDVEVVGGEQLADFFRSAFDALDLELTVLELVADGDRVAVELRERVVADGVEVFEAIAAFYLVEVGLIRTVKVYREGSATT
jgi:ketosteroid isomerase-like protein